MLGNTKLNSSERRPDAERLAAMRDRSQLIRFAVADVAAVTKRTQPNATIDPIIKPKSEVVTPKIVTSEVASNVILQVAKQEAVAEAKAEAEQTESVTDQDRRIADARNATDAAHGPNIDELLQDIGYEPAA